MTMIVHIQLGPYIFGHLHNFHHFDSVCHQNVKKKKKKKLVENLLQAMAALSLELMDITRDWVLCDALPGLYLS